MSHWHRLWSDSDDAFNKLNKPHSQIVPVPWHDNPADSRSVSRRSRLTAKQTKYTETARELAQIYLGLAGKTIDN